MSRLSSALALAGVLGGTLAAASDRVLFDFESGTYEGWTVEGDAFGVKPFDAAAVVPAWRDDRRFQGYQGRFMVIVGDSRHESTPPGRLVSRSFTIDRAQLNFYFGAELRPTIRRAPAVAAPPRGKNSGARDRS